MMKKILIGLGVLVVLVVLLIGAGIFGTFYYLNSTGFKDGVVAAINKTYDAHISLDTLKIGLSGLELEGIKIPNLPPHQQDNFLTVKSVKVDFKWVGNPPGNLPLGKIEVNDPAVSLYVKEKGGVDFPFKLPTGGNQAAADSTGTPSNAQPINISLSDIQVHNALAKVTASDDSVLLNATGADVKATYDKHGIDQRATADIHVTQVRVMPGVQLGNFHAPVVFESNVVKVSPFTADCHGGSIKGVADANLINQQFNAEAHLIDVETSGLLADMGSPSDTMNGKLSLNFTGKGLISDAKNLSGQGDLKIPSPVIGKLQAFKEIGSVLGLVGGVSALKDGKFDEINSKFTIAEQKVKLDPLNVESRNLSIQLLGDVGFDKKLNLNGVVRMAPGLLQVTEAVGKVGNLLGGLMGGGNSTDQTAQPPAENKAATAITMPLSITGTADDPKVNLTKETQDKAEQTATEVATDPQKREQKKQDLGNLLNSLNPFKKKAEPAPAAAAPATADPAATPTP